MRAGPGGMSTGGSQLSAQAIIEGWMRCERHGVLWQGIRKPTVMVVSAGVRWAVEGGCGG